MLRLFQKHKFDAVNDKKTVEKVNYFTESGFCKHKILRVFVIHKES